MSVAITLLKIDRFFDLPNLKQPCPSAVFPTPPVNDLLVDLRDRSLFTVFRMTPNKATVACMIRGEGRIQATEYILDQVPYLEEY